MNSPPPPPLPTDVHYNEKDIISDTQNHTIEYRCIIDMSGDNNGTHEKKEPKSTA